MRGKANYYIVYLLELLDTTALIVPIKTVFYLSFMLTLSDISMFKLIMTIALFICEVPAGYFADTYGNKRTLVLSYFLVLVSIILLIFSQGYPLFLLSNLLLGIALALSSGTKNTLQLLFCKNSNLEYKKIKIKVSAHKKLFELVLMLTSGFLYSINIYFPFIICAILYILLLILTISMKVKEPISKDDKVNSRMFIKSSKTQLRKIITTKSLMLEILFFSIMTSILISSFDFYNVLFKSIGIETTYFGAIYSSFMFINFIGLKIYSQKIQKKYEVILFYLLSLSFLFLIIDNIILIFIGIIVQQLLFSYLFIHFEIYVINSIEDLKTSSHFQSMISFIYSSIRICILLLITFMLRIIPVSYMYVIYTVVMLLSSILYAKNRVKST